MKKSGKVRKYIFADARVKTVSTTANNLVQLLTDLRMEREKSGENICSQRQGRDG